MFLLWKRFAILREILYGRDKVSEIQVIYEKNAAKRYAVIRDLVNRIPDGREIMGIFNAPMHPVIRVRQYESKSRKERKNIFHEVSRFVPDVIIVDGISREEVDYYRIDRGHDLIIGCYEFDFDTA